MPAVSQNQRKAMAIAEHHPEDLNPENAGLANMSKPQLHEFASTPEKGLPKKKTKPSSKSQDRIKIARHVMKSVRAKM